MKTYNYNLNNNTPKNNYTFFNTFCTKSTDYSKTLDDLIYDDLMDKNPWLSKYTKNNLDTLNIISKTEKANESDDALFIKAFNYLSDYDDTDKYFIKDKYYELADGGLFCISDNYLYIDGKFYWFDKIKKNNKFYTLFTPKLKKTICTIYTDSLKITIKA